MEGRANIGQNPAPAADVVRWKHVATVLYNELKRWGWGDFHYGSQPQEKRVVEALAVYEEAARIDGRDDV